MNSRDASEGSSAPVDGATCSTSTDISPIEVAQRKADLAVRLLGPDAAVREGEDRRVATWLLAMRGATIGGGTSEILRNQIGERLLGLPRDPLIR